MNYKEHGLLALLDPDEPEDLGPGFPLFLVAIAAVIIFVIIKSK